MSENPQPTYGTDAAQPAAPNLSKPAQPEVQQPQVTGPLTDGYQPQTTGPLPGAQPGYAQPMYAQATVTMMTPQQMEGQKAAQTSMTLGIIGLVLNFFGFFMWFFGIGSLILGIIGVKKAGQAEQFGVAASGGRIMGWINLVIGALELLVLVGVMFLIIAFGAASTSR